MRTLGPLVGTLAIFLILSGCTSSVPNQVSPSATPGGSATVTPDTGGIEGLVATDEQMPIQGVEVGLVELGRSVQTDAEGRFAFSQLAPGKYQLVTQRIGYEPLAKKVDVVPGDATEITLVLQPTQLVESYYDGPFIFDGHIQAGGLLIDVLASDASSATGVGKCDRCNLYFNTSNDVSEIVFELKFTPTIQNPTADNILEFQLWSVDADGSLKENYGIDAWSSGQKRSFNKETALSGSDAGAMPAAKGSFLWFSYCEAFFVCTDQRFQIYYTVFHNGRAQEGFTALPTP